MKLENIVSHSPLKTDTWEVGMFKEDCEGHELHQALLGVRVNGGTWLSLQALLDFTNKFVDSNERDG